MLEIPVYDVGGKELDPIEVDAALFGGRVQRDLLRQAVLRYENNQRAGTAATKSRGMVRASGQKLYRQKGTGRARAGSRRTNIRRGGAVAFAKRSRSFRQRMPRKARRAALDSALLAKMIDGEVCVLSNLEVSEPKTKSIAEVLDALAIRGPCVISTAVPDVNVWKSARNIPRVRVRPVSDLNPWEVLWPRRLVFTREAFDALLSARSE